MISHSYDIAICFCPLPSRPNHLCPFPCCLSPTSSEAFHAPPPHRFNGFPCHSNNMSCLLTAFVSLSHEYNDMCPIMSRICIYINLINVVYRCVWRGVGDLISSQDTDSDSGFVKPVMMEAIYLYISIPGNIVVKHCIEMSHSNFASFYCKPP